MERYLLDSQSAKRKYFCSHVHVCLQVKEAQENSQSSLERPKHKRSDRKSLFRFRVVASIGIYLSDELMVAV